MTLIHRWGTDEPIMLTEASLSDMSKRIDIANLSQTYRDAIAITRSLGVRYLWIDSLCIIQDSKVDWQTEAARMGDIYKFSVCTIAASWASSNSEGCFFDRGPLYAKFGLSKIAQSAPQPSKRVHPKESDSERRRRLRLGTAPVSDIDSTEFECLLERRRSRLSTEIVGHRRDLLSNSLTRSSCTPASTMSPVIDAYLAGNETLGTRRSETISRLEFMTNHDNLEDIQSGSPDCGALESSATSRIDSKSERHCPKSSPEIQTASNKPGCIQNAILYILPFRGDLWKHSVDSSPLSRRAWVLQERLLSPRTLHYTKTQVFWECRESKACESSPHPSPKLRIHPLRTHWYPNSKHELFGLNVEPLYRHWPDIIEKYTDTLLTKPEDKLVAISGLAR